MKRDDTAYEDVFARPIRKTYVWHGSMKMCLHNIDEDVFAGNPDAVFAQR